MSTPTPSHGATASSSSERGDASRAGDHDRPRRTATGSRLPFAAIGWLLLAGFSAGAAWIGNVYDGSPIVSWADMNTLRAWQIAYAVGVLGYLLLLLSFRVRPAGTRTIVLAAIALRVPLLFCPPNSDTNRYVWEGRIQGLGFSPYTVGPLDPKLEPHRDEIWKGINKKKFSTVYPPLSELEFRLLSTIRYSTKSPQIAHTILDLGVIAALAGLLAMLGRPAWYLAIYALCPLTLASFAHAGHNDTLMILPMLGFVAAAIGKRWPLAGALLGLAILAKTTAAILIAVLIRRSRLAVAVALGTVAAGYLLYPDAYVGLDTMARWPEDGPFNSLFDELRIRWNRASDWDFHAGPRMTVAMILLSAAAAWRVWRPRDILLDTRWLMALAVLFLPIIHFWYVAWPLALITLNPRAYWSWLILPATMTLYWLSDWSHLVGKPWRLELWAVATIWLPFFTAWIIETIWVRRTAKRDSSAVPPGGALNADGGLSEPRRSEPR